MSETNGHKNGHNPTIAVIKPDQLQPTTQQASEPVQDQANQPVVAAPQATPEPTKTEERKPITGKLAIVLIGVLLVVNACQAILVRPRVQDQPVAVPSPPPAPVATPQVPNIDLNQSVVRRNVALSDAMKEVDSQVGQVVCSRTEYLLRQAQQQMEIDGTPIEVSLLRRLDYIRTEMRNTLLQTSQLTGSPEQSQVARQLAIDSQALLTALQFDYTGDPIPPCRVAMAPLLEKIDAVYGLAIQSRQVTTEQQLRNSSIQMRQYQPIPQTEVSPSPQPSPSPQSPLP